MSETPTAESIQQSLTKLAKYFKPAEQQEFDAVNQQIPRDAQGKVDDAAWEQLPDATRVQLNQQLADLLKRLRRPEIVVGRWTQGVVVAAILILAIAHISIHRPSPSALTTIDGDAIQIGAGLTTVKSEAESLRSQDEKDRDFTGLSSAIAALTKNVRAMKSSVQSRRLLGVLQSNAERKTVPDAITVDQLDNMLMAELENQSFFWDDGGWRWLELAWWAEFGVLVGILFYMAGQLSDNRCAVADVPMFVAEIVVAPIVVVVIFFLFQFSGITAVSPSKESIYVNIGLAFVLGFAIRRTLGLIDIIKKKLLPDPAPANAQQQPS